MKKKIIINSILSLFLIILTILVINESILVIDNKIYYFIAQYISNFNTKIFKAITFLGSTFFIIFITLVLALIYKKRRGGLIILTILLSTLLNNLIKIVIRRPRPDINRLVYEASFSYPSGHTMAISSLVGIIIYLLWHNNSSKKRGGKIILTIILSILPILVMLSRIYLGIHYFSDCLAGYLSSIILVISITLFIDNKKSPSI